MIKKEELYLDIIKDLQWFVTEDIANESTDVTFLLCEIQMEVVDKLKERIQELPKESDERLYLGMRLAMADKKLDALVALSNFEQSVIQARESGVPEDRIIKNKDDLDNYFMN